MRRIYFVLCLSRHDALDLTYIIPPPPPTLALALFTERCLDGDCGHFFGRGPPRAEASRPLLAHPTLDLTASARPITTTSPIGGNVVIGVMGVIEPGGAASSDRVTCAAGAVGPVGPIDSARPAGCVGGNRRAEPTAPIFLRGESYWGQCARDKVHSVD